MEYQNSGLSGTLNVADVIIMHSVPMSLSCITWKKQSNLCVALNFSLGCLWFNRRFCTPAALSSAHSVNIDNNAL